MLMVQLDPGETGQGLDLATILRQHAGIKLSGEHDAHLQ
jgi:hypothetical protein